MTDVMTEVKVMGLFPGQAGQEQGPDRCDAVRYDTMGYGWNHC